MRVLLVYPNASKEIIGWGDLGAVAEPIALEYVGAGARLDGHDVRILDLRLHPGDLESTLRDFQPEAAGVTGYSMHVLRNLEICRSIKAVLPSCRTVAGGHHATLEPIDFHEPEIDFVVTGEGVRPFRAILAALARGAAASGIPGVWSRSEAGFVFGGEQDSIELDALPRPDRSLTAGDRHRYYIDWMRPIALLRTTVGCPFRCSFCSLWRIMDGHYVRREIDAVVEELRAIEERFVFFVDDEAFIDSRRMWALAEAIEQADLGKHYFAYSRIDSLLRDLDLMRLWHRVGLRRLFIGIETVSENQLREYNKRQKRDEIVRALEAAREIGISLFSNFIIHPNSTKKDFDDLVRFIEQNDVEYPAFTVLTPIPGTGSSYDDVVARQPNGRPNWSYFDLQHAVTPTALPPEEFAREYENLYRVFKSRYASSESELSLQHYRDRSERLREHYMRIALRALGGSPPRPTEPG